MNQPVFAQAGQLKWAWASGSLCWAGQSRPPVIWLQWTVSRVGVSCPGLSNTKNYSPRAVTETAVQTESMYLLGSWGRATFPKGHLGTHLPDGGAAVVGALKASPAGLVLADFKQTLQSPWAEPLPAGTVIY